MATELERAGWGAGQDGERRSWVEVDRKKDLEW
jgi:hypothetical protein